MRHGAAVLNLNGTCSSDPRLAARRFPQSRILPQGIKGRLILLIACALVPMILLQAWIYYDRLREAERQELISEVEIARGLGHDFETYLRNLERHERGIGKALLALGPLSRKDIESVLRAEQAEFAPIRAFFWVGPDGKVLAATGNSASIRRLKRQPFFEKMYRDPGAFLSEMIISPEDGSALVYIAHGTRHASGKLAGTLVAELDADALGPDALPLKRTNGGVFALFDPQGRVVYRWPVGQLTPPQRADWLRSDHLLQQVLSSKTEHAGVTHISIGDINEWLSARVPLKSGWVLGTGRARSIALAPIWRAMRRDAALLLAVDVFVFFLALLISRTISTPILALARPDSDKNPPGPAFDWMAAKEVKALRHTIVSRTEGLRARQTELEEAVQARDEVMAIVSHDLRNPLGSIVMNASLLKRMESSSTGRIDPKRATLLSSRILRASERMEQLIQDLLDVTRLESGGMALEIQPESMTSLIQEAQEMFEPLAAEKSLTLQFQVEPKEGGGILSMDRKRILQVLSNLIGNAIKFTPEGGAIDVTVKEESERWVFAVSDSGSGIPEEEQKHVFDRFWQARRATKKGLGLGLFICKGIVEGHGGHIQVESQPGRGTRFQFEIPTRRKSGEGLAA